MRNPVFDVLKYIAIVLVVLQHYMMKYGLGMGMGMGMGMMDGY